MVQRLVIMAGGKGAPRIVRSLPRPFDRPRMLAEAGVEEPTPGRPVRIPLGAMRWRTGERGLTWSAEAGTKTVAYFEISVD
jgi:hypothetical protein